MIAALADLLSFIIAVTPKVGPFTAIYTIVNVGSTTHGGLVVRQVHRWEPETQ